MTAGAIGWTIHHDPGAAVRVVGFVSEQVAGFRLECPAGFVGIRIAYVLAAVLVIVAAPPARAENVLR